MKISAPGLRKTNIAIPLPIPEFPPVINATVPVKSKSLLEELLLKDHDLFVIMQM